MGPERAYTITATRYTQLEDGYVLQERKIDQNREIIQEKRDLGTKCRTSPFGVESFRLGKGSASRSKGNRGKLKTQDMKRIRRRSSV